MRHSAIRRAVLETLESRLLLSTYYVSNSGSDSHNGSSSAPFLTLQHAMMSLQPGDTLNVASGTYAGFVVGWDSTPASGGDAYGTIDGTASAPITIQAAPGAAAGSVVITSKSSKTQAGVDLEPGDNYINIIGLTVDGSSGGLAQYPNKGEGMKIAGNNDSVINCTITNINYGFGIIADNANNALIEANSISNIHNHSNADYGHGIYLSGSTNGAIVSGNTIFNNDYIGIHVNGDISEGGNGLVTNAVIENNIIYNNGQNGMNCDGLQNSVVENNLIYGYQNYGIALYQIDAAAGSSNNLIVNNTLVPGSGALAGLRILDASTGNTVFNNILLGGSQVAMRISNDSLPGLHSDYNVVNNLFQSEDTGATQSLSQWRTATGQDSHSILAPASLTSLFASPSTNNYQLAAGSPAIGAGVGSFNSMIAPATDLASNPRPTAAGWDVGAYEYQSGAVTTPPPTLTLSGASNNIAGSSYSLTLASSDSGNDQMTSWLIHWGDGSNSTIAAGSETLFNGAWITSTTGSHNYSTSGTYTISATATDGTGTYAAGNSVSVTVVAPPAAPNGLAAAAVSSSGINLSWAESSNNSTGFLIERSTNGVTFTQIASVAAGSTSYNDGGLAAGTTYTYRVRATSSAGNSAYSNIASATTSSSTIAPAPPSVPAAPSAMAAQVAGSSQINLSWTETSNNATGCLIERSSDGTTFTQVGTTGANVYSYSDSGLTAGTTYFYRVVATSSAGNSTPSTIISATTAANSTGVAADRQKIAADRLKLNGDTRASRLALASDRKLIASTKAADLSIVASDRRTIARNRSLTPALDVSRETLGSDLAKFRTDVAGAQATLKADILHWKQVIQADNHDLSADRKQLAKDLALAKKPMKGA